MKINTILANNETANIIRNLYPLFLYDISEIYGNVPNEFGIYEEEPVKTLGEQYHIQDTWFQNPELLYPFIIFADKKPAGFALAATGKYAPKTTDYFMYEFFLLRPYRGNNIAEIAAKQVFDKFKGKWEIYTNPTSSNKRGQAFWHKTVNNYTSGNFEEIFGTTFDGEKLIFKFDNNCGIEIN